jgi:DNA helicase II / ATP-dependent DNA helicase PcrA
MVIVNPRPLPDPPRRAGRTSARLGVEQRAAAAIGLGPVRVVAGAGTGKTAVIAERFRRLVAEGAPPDSILVMTFTDRAASEMRQRIEDLIGAPAPAVGTFHSIALGWLRADGRLVGVPASFRILAGADRWILARELMWDLGDPAFTGDERPDDLVSPALQMLERLKQELVPLKNLAAWAASTKGAETDSATAERAQLMQACVRLFRAYERACRKQRLLDFEDLLTLAVRLLDEQPALLRMYCMRYPHVLVDEYQDLNLAQERLVELIAQGGEPFIVGDDDQSIYRFRGASRASLERFRSHFPSAVTVTLGRNHRSSRRIVTAAAALIENNSDRLPKELRSSRTGHKVELWLCPDGGTEASAIAAEAERLVADGVPLPKIAVLCRTNAIARPIANSLAARRLPHVVIGGHGFYDRPEVKDVIALLRVLRDPTDVVALARALTRPPSGLDPTAALTKLRDRNGAPPLHTLERWAPSAAFAALVGTLSKQAAILDVRDLFFELMEKSRYLEVLSAGLETSEAARATANVSRFAEVIAEFCETATDRSLETYMRHLELVLLSGEDEEPATVEGLVEAIQVMTIHQAKGLEFEAVFVPGLVEGRLPQSGRSPRFELPPAVLEPLVRGREDVVAEERRLLYVAMTRARQRLYLTRASHYEGGRRWRDSRFLAEVRSAGARTVAEREVTASSSPSPQPSRFRGGTPLGARGLAEPVPGAPPSRRGEGEIVLSYSAIAAYRDCPRQYWYRYEQRLPSVQSAEAVQGVILHEVLRRAGEARQRGESVTAALLHSLHDLVWSAKVFPDLRRAPTFRRNGANQLEAYRKRGGFEARPEYLEQPFTTALDGWTLRGVIDRIDRTESGWRILDYKSGRPVARGRRDLQVALYALGAAASLMIELHGGAPESGSARPGALRRDVPPQQGGAPGSGSARPGALRRDVPPRQGGAPESGSARPGALRRDVPPRQGGAPESGSARPGALRGDVPPRIDLEVVYLASGETLRLERPDALVVEAQKQGTEVAEGARAGHFEARPDRRRCRLCPYRLACAEAL